MSKDRSLGDFVGENESAAESTDEVEDDPEVIEGDDATKTVDSDDSTETVDSDDDPETIDGVDPATPTYRFAPDGARCEVCDETVEERWHDDGRFVCGDCKDW